MLSERQKHLLELLLDGEFHSGNELAKILSVSRTAVWKHLQVFADLGLEISAVSGKGYRLINTLDLLHADKITSLLPSALRGAVVEIRLFDQIDSTNSYLMRAAREGLASGTVCLAEYQSAGRGRRGRQWVSPFGSNIYLSLLWRFNQGIAVIGGLSLALGVAVIRALRGLGYEGVGLKWPNDIFWQQRKLGGILVEVSGESNGPCAIVIGLGLNVSVPTASAKAIDQAWVDLQQMTGSRAIDRNILAAALIAAMVETLAVFDALGLQSFLPEWRSYDCMLDKQVTVLLYGREVNGLVKGVNDEGLLLLQLADGSINSYASGEISFNSVRYENSN